MRGWRNLPCLQTCSIILSNCSRLPLSNFKSVGYSICCSATVASTRRVPLLAGKALLSPVLSLRSILFEGSTPCFFLLLALFSSTSEQVPELLFSLSDEEVCTAVSFDGDGIIPACCNTN